MFSVGLEHAKLHLSFGGSGKLSGPNFQTDNGFGFNSFYQSFFAGAGITVNLFRDL
jgi:hypothetical protein